LPRIIKFPRRTLERDLLESLKKSLASLENIRMFSSPEELQLLAELKAAIRAHIKRLENPGLMAAD